MVQKFQSRSQGITGIHNEIETMRTGLPQVRKWSGKSQGILKSDACGNRRELEIQHLTVTG